MKGMLRTIIFYDPSAADIDEWLEENNIEEVQVFNKTIQEFNNYAPTVIEVTIIGRMAHE